MSQAWIDFLHLIFSMVCLYICVFVHFAGLWLQELLKEALKFSQDVPYKSVHVYCVQEFHWIPWCSHNDIVYTHLLRGDWDMILSAFCIHFVPFCFHPSIYLCMYLGKTFLSYITFITFRLPWMRDPGWSQRQRRFVEKQTPPHRSSWIRLTLTLEFYKLGR